MKENRKRTRNIQLEGGQKRLERKLMPFGLSAYNGALAAAAKGAAGEEEIPSSMQKKTPAC